ncbi:MAG: SDR family oxidoreductase [Methylocella sp.]
MPSVLIAGGNRGLGFEFAKQYAADGWRVYAACRDPSNASDLLALAETRQGIVEVLALDVTDLASARSAAAKLDDRPVDLLLNNAGIGGPPRQTIGAIDYGSWAKVLDVNTMGPMRVTEAFADNVTRSDRKLVVTITSGMGSLAGNTSGGAIAYRSSKAAVNMVMRSLAIDLAPRGISCVLVSPGWVRTGMGGGDATLAPAESVAALRRLIETLGPTQSGKFFRYDGREYAW